MFGVSFFELITIFAVALIVFGPEKLPEIARALGKISGELSKQSNALRREFYNSVYTPAEDLRSRLNTEVRELRSVSSVALEPPAPAPGPDASPTMTAPGKPANVEPSEQK